MITPSLFKLALICGGPSAERGISLNSARSVLDHLKSPYLDIIPIYVDSQKQFYHLSQAQLYSNTPADFDFKLRQIARQLDSATLQILLKEMDLVFPVIHGAFGEDGQLQDFLERLGVPFVGQNSSSCQRMFNKSLANQILKKNGFQTLPQGVFSQDQDDLNLQISAFFKDQDLHQVVVKPVMGGSSIGVSIARSPEEAYQCISEIFEKQLDSQALIEPFCTGKEFTIVVFEGINSKPIALVPTEVELSSAGPSILDFRKKYLLTNQAIYHTPPRFPTQITEKICRQAEEIFNLFEMRDFVRLDGWWMPDDRLYFTDMNPMSGLEQNSFLFRQASLVGLSHQETLEYILKRTCQRYGLVFPERDFEIEQNKKPVYVLFGSNNAERQVSLMSGTNVWLKLLQSKYYTSTPFFLDPHGMVWQLPYSFTLNHSVEEIYANCVASHATSTIWQQFFAQIQQALRIKPFHSPRPRPFSLNGFLEEAQREDAFVFIAMHGGEGENGELQKKLQMHELPFNGSNAETSALCMDKSLTGQRIALLNDPHLVSLPKKSVQLQSLKNDSPEAYQTLWEELCHYLGSCRLVIKPCSDGCSAGIVLLESSHDLYRYCQFLFEKADFIPAHSFAFQSSPVEMPSFLEGTYLLEPYIETDDLFVQESALHHVPKQGWIELTVGVLEKGGVYHALNPSITVAAGSLLSLEEKFQGGTGVNLTPPPLEIISDASTQNIKRLVERAAQALGIENYARLDVFFNRISEKMILIEANTLPGLTPSTVLYHQGLAEENPLTPLALLDKIISSKLNCES